MYQSRGDPGTLIVVKATRFELSFGIKTKQGPVSVDAEHGPNVCSPIATIVTLN